MWHSDQHRSYLEHVSDHDDFTRNGVHYVSWVDVIFNISGRPTLGWKMLWLLISTTTLVYIGIYDVTGTVLDQVLLCLPHPHFFA